MILARIIKKYSSLYFFKIITIKARLRKNQMYSVSLKQNKNLKKSQISKYIYMW